MWLERLYDVINPTHPAFGSSANIVLHTIQTSRIFDSLKTFWIWPMLQQLDPYKNEQRFLSTFLTLVDLGSFIDNRALADHVGRTPIVQQYRPPSFMHENVGYVITGLVKFLQGTEHWSIHAGVIFAQYVVAAFTMTQFLNDHTFSSHIVIRRFPVEITVLCRLLELVAGSFIMASAFKWKGSLHGVTLPRSWILENVQKIHRVQHKNANIGVIWEILPPLQDLLERIYSGTDSDIGEPNMGKLLSSCSTILDLLHQNRPLSSFPFRIRNFALARL